MPSLTALAHRLNARIAASLGVLVQAVIDSALALIILVLQPTRCGTAT
jgi:hypothetical protein